MIKHRGFPGRLPSTDHQFVIRRANKAGATKLIRRERFRDRANTDRAADEGFLKALWLHFGEEPFERGNLDAGRISWLLGREVVAVGELDPTDYEQLLKLDLKRAEASFPELFAEEPPEFDWEEVDFGDEGDADWDDD